MRTEAPQTLSYSMSLQIILFFYFLLNRVEGQATLRQKISSTKSQDKTVVIDCDYSSGCYSYIHWYQLKGETLKRILYAGISGEPGKDNVVTPKLTGYLNQATKKPVALCQARDMFPDLVSFKWEKSSNGGWSEVPKEQIVEQSHNEDPVTSMVILNTEDSTYRCTVTHEGSSKNPEAIEIKRDEKPSVNKPIDVPDATCPPSTDETPISQESDNPEKKQSLQLFVYGYAVMLMKNVLYFIVVFIVLLKRKAGKKEERS